MRKLFLYTAAALTLTACSSTDVIDESVQSPAIGFNTLVGKNSRALTNTNFNKFYVYGSYTKSGAELTPFQVFHGETVTKTDGSWSYDDKRYWIPGASYKFFAYSCDGNAINGDNGTVGYPLVTTDTYTGPAQVLNINNYICNSSHQHDLVYAKAAGNPIIGLETNNKNVSFNFKHILSRVNVKFTSNFTDDYKIAISNVHIVNIRDKGNYAWSDPTTVSWVKSSVNRTDADKFINLDIEADKNIAINGQSEEEKVRTAYGYVIPYHYAENNVRLEFDITLYKQSGARDNELRESDIQVLQRHLKGSWAPKWNEGYSYTYNVLLDGTAASLEPIVFETAEDMNLDNWTPGTTQIDFNFSGN